MRTYLQTFRQRLQKNFDSIDRRGGTYVVPDLWVDERGARRRRLRVDPAQFVLASLNRILGQRKRTSISGRAGTWTRRAVIYNLFLRTTCAFDHDQNGRIDLPVNANGWRETGTFLKAIALLPYIKSLGANVVHLLPITSIGVDGNKGTLGSPYAIKNPYVIDEHLSEPLVQMTVDEQFRAFTEAAHHLGLKVVLEFVFRTSAKDGDWVKEHPEWFYWIREDVQDREPGHADESKYGSPIFTPEELAVIKPAGDAGKFDHLIPPHATYTSLFTEPPMPESVRRDDSRYVGVLRDGTRVRIPGAFADWPPDDNQPPWNDVTYLRMYDHPNFNYIAYNTIRMYDRRLAQPEYVNTELWNRIVEIIPHYQHEFGIDGVMIDMGHALPMDLKREMISRARAIDPDFAFWDENFSVEARSVEEGYNAVVGYSVFDQHKPEKYTELLRRFGTSGYPLPFFATTENHNTHRAAARDGGIHYTRYTWAINNFIPAVPFLHSGFELGETYPINTGLEFTQEELQQLPSEHLPLFSEYAYDWTRSHHLLDWIRRVAAVRRKYESLIIDSSIESFRWIDTGKPNMIAFVRGRRSSRRTLLVCANANMHRTVSMSVPVQATKRRPTDLLSGKTFMVKRAMLTGKLAPGQVAVFEL
jgi:starch synthase (maltosyl-transferring)